eukprot:s621_g33.t1
MLPLSANRSQSGPENLRESLASGASPSRSPEARLVRAVSGESRPDEQAASFVEEWLVEREHYHSGAADLCGGTAGGEKDGKSDCCLHSGNIAPIIYKAATRRRPGNLVVAIGCFQVVAVLSLLATMVLWHSTPILLVCTVLAGSVGCMSSVTYWAAVAQRPASCVRAMSVGMTLGGLLATGFAALQLGGRKQGNPRFSPEIFFLLAAVMQAGQGAMFVWRSLHSAHHDTPVAAGTAAGGDAEATASTACATEKGPMPRIAKFLMAGCFVVYATTYTMPTLMPFMAGHYTDPTEAGLQALLVIFGLEQIQTTYSYLFNT